MMLRKFLTMLAALSVALGSPVLAQPVSSLPAATAPDSDDVLHIVEDGNSRKVTPKQITRCSGCFGGALVTKAADQTTANYTAAPAIAWDTETGGYDTDSIHDNSTNNTRLTVPSGVTKVRLQVGVRIEALTADVYHGLFLTKNGSLTYVGAPQVKVEAGSVVGNLNLTSPVLSVTAGDYFEILLEIETDTSVTIKANSSWFAMEIIE